jgi:hypothetical protein
MEGLVDTPMPFPEANFPTRWIAQDAVQFIRDHRTRPFFLHGSFPDPRFPNTVCEEYCSM